jgi:hypothetical protein
LCVSILRDFNTPNNIKIHTGCSLCDGCSFADHHVDDERGAVCFIGPVRTLQYVDGFNKKDQAENNETTNHQTMEAQSSPNKSNTTTHSSGISPSQAVASSSNDSPRNAATTTTTTPLHTSSSFSEITTNGYITARRLLECQRDQLVASSQHPAMLQEVYSPITLHIIPPFLSFFLNAILCVSTTTITNHLM